MQVSHRSCWICLFWPAEFIPMLHGRNSGLFEKQVLAALSLETGFLTSIIVINYVSLHILFKYSFFLGHGHSHSLFNGALDHSHGHEDHCHSHGAKHGGAHSHDHDHAHGHGHLHSHGKSCWSTSRGQQRVRLQTRRMR